MKGCSFMQAASCLRACRAADGGNLFVTFSRMGSHCSYLRCAFTLWSRSEGTIEFLFGPETVTLMDTRSSV